MKAKKTLLMLGTIAATASSVATLISCSKNTKVKFDQTYDGEIAIANSFSASGKQTLAIKSIRDKWNDYVKENKEKDPELLPLKIVTMPGGFPAIQSDLQTKLPAKSANNLYNMVLNYPNIIALLNKYDMALNLTEFDSNGKQVKRSESKIASHFNEVNLKINDEIAALEKGGLYGLPVSRSTQVLNIDGPVMGYVLEKALEAENPLTFETKDDEKYFKKMIALIKDKKKSDYETVDQIWKGNEPGGYVHNSNTLAGYVLSKEKLSNFETLFDLSQRIKKAFPKAEEGHEAKSAKNVLGIDDFANMLYTYAFSKVEGDYSKFLFSVEGEGEKTTIHFNKLFDKNTKEYALFKESFDVLSEIIRDGTLYIKEKSFYSSSKMKQHRLLFAIASTASYWANYVASKSVYEYDFRSLKGNENAVAATGYGDLALIKPTAEETKKGIAAKTVSFLSLENPTNYKYILYEDANSELLYNQETLDEIAKKLINFEKKDKLTEEEKKEKSELLLKINEEMKKEDNTIIARNSKTDIAFKSIFSKVEEGAFAGIQTVSSDVKGLSQKLKDEFLISANGGNWIIKADNFITLSDKDKYDSDEKGVRILKQESKNFLNKNELFFTEAPEKATLESKKKVILSQGPSLIGIHANEKENKAVIKFLDWFTNHKYEGKEQWEVKKTDGGKERDFEGSALEFWGVQSGYLVPSKKELSKEWTNENPDGSIDIATTADLDNYFKGKLEKGKYKAIVSSRPDPFALWALNLFNKVVTKEEYSLFEDPTDSRTGAFRDSLNAAFVAYKNRARGDKQYNETFEQFINKLEKPLN